MYTQYKVMVVYHLDDGHGRHALTSQLLEFMSEVDAEKAIKAVRKTHQSAIDTRTIQFIRFYESKAK